MQIAEADVLGRRVDEQVDRLLPERAVDHAVAHRDQIFIVNAALGTRRGPTASRPNVLALMADAGRALADRKSTPLAKIVAPRIAVAGRSSRRGIAVSIHLGT